MSSIQRVLCSPEVRRVRDLPHTDWRDHTPDLTTELKLLTGTMRLRPIQSAMLAAARQHRGGFFPARTGSGKLLTSLLIPTVLEARRPVLLIPASRKVPTYQAIRELSLHWRLRPITIVTYSDLSAAKNHDLLTRLQPDVIIADEAHALKDPQGSRWRRIMRVDRSVPFFAMSGSFANRDLNEYRHLCVRALGDRAPVPHDWIEGQLWGRALNPRSMAPMAPGALMELMPDVGADEDVRSVFGRRLISAPGVISSGSDIPDIPLTFARRDLPGTADMRAAERRMLGDWLTPCDWPIDTAIDMWRHLRELSHGMYYRWVDPPPEHWLQARKELALFLRAHTSGRSLLDTPSQVFAAVATGDIQDTGVVAQWAAVKDDYTPVMKPVWLDDSTLDACATWLGSEQGIVWVSVSEFGERLAQLTNVPYFRQGGEDANGVHIENHRGPAIASVASCSTGHNLQHHQKNLVLSVPSPIQLEQLISRTHRDGQEKDVQVDFLLRLDSDHKALDKAIEDAQSVSSTFHVVQRLLYGDWT